MPEVFLSYRHENREHIARVRRFADKLEEAGITVTFDEFSGEREFHGGGPEDGWPLWSTRHADQARSVVVVASAGWFQVLSNSAPVEQGRGAAAEAKTVFNRLYRCGMRNDFLAFAYFDERHDFAALPATLDGVSQFNLLDDGQLARLVTWLRRPEPRDPVKREPPCQLPAVPQKQFFGREEQRRELSAGLRAAKNAAVVGPAGYGKTALSAVVLRGIVGENGARLAGSPFPHGIVNLDMYRHHGQVEPAWNELADAIAGAEFLPQSPGRERAAQACRGRRFLVVIEGGEDCPRLAELCAVLAEPNRWLLLTRDGQQAAAADVTIKLRDVLAPKEAAGLFDLLTGGRVTGAVRNRVLDLLDGHPLALTWAGGLLSLEDEDPTVLANEWEDSPVLRLSDPRQVEHTLAWLFSRSVRTLDETARRMLDAAGLLGRAPFPAEALKHAVATPAARKSLRRLLHLGLLRLAPDDHREFTHVLGYQFARNETSSDPELRQRLAEWLRERLAEQCGPHAPREDYISNLLDHAAALLRADHDQQLWQTLAYFVLYDFLDRLVSLGRPDWVRTALSAISAWLDRLPAHKAAESVWQRERSVCLCRLGDLATVQGNLPEAQRLYGEAQRLAESDPANALWQYDLGTSNERLGDVATAQRNLDEANRRYSARRDIIQGLAESDPANAGWQRDLSVSFEKLGDLAMAQGNLPEAQRLFADSLRIAQRLTESDPNNAEWQRDLLYSLKRCGQLLMQQERWGEALQLLEQSLAIDERLAALAPTNVMYQEDVAISRQLAADVKAKAGRSS